MTPFETWFQELCSNHVWAEPARLKHRPETFKSICERVYMDYLAGNGVKSIEECRRHVYNIVVKTPGDNKKVDWVKMALEKTKEKKEEEWKPAAPEKVDEYVRQIQDIIKKSPMMNSMPRIPHKQQVEEGGWIPKKDAPYPATTPMEYYLKQRHIAYLLKNYDARTREPLPGWTSEEEFNTEYDKMFLDKSGL